MQVETITRATRAPQFRVRVLTVYGYTCAVCGFDVRLGETALGVEAAHIKWKYVLAWIPMVCIAIINGAIRESWYGRHMSELQAHQISTVSGVLLFGVYIWVLVRLWRPASAEQALTIGLVWLRMAVAFELLFGHYVAKRSWSALLHDYNLFAGRVWLVVLVWVTLAPYLFYRLRQESCGQRCPHEVLRSPGASYRPSSRQPWEIAAYGPKGVVQRLAGQGLLTALQNDAYI